MNSVSIIGNLARGVDMSAKATTSVARFVVAVNRGKDKNGEDLGADYINCVTFGKTAENMDRYSFKGMKVGVQGHIRTGSYEKSDGTKVYTTDVVADRVEFLSKGTEKRDNDSKSDPVYDGFNKTDDDIPF